MLKSQKDRPYYIEWQDGKCHVMEVPYSSYHYDLYFAMGNIIELADEENGRLISQCYFYDSFFVDLIQVDTLVPFCFNLRVPQRFLYLFFMLEGECSYGGISEGDPIYSFADIFQVGCLAPGKYEVVCQPGANVGLILIVDMEWLFRITVSYGHIQQVLERYNASNSQSELLSRKSAFFLGLACLNGSNRVNLGQIGSLFAFALVAKVCLCRSINSRGNGR